MGFLDEHRTMSWLFGPFGQSVRNEKKAPCADAGAPERVFDIADCMEKGLARELVSDFVQPLRDVSGLWRFNVERSPDRREYRLRCAQGEFLMLAKVSKDGRDISFFLYDTQDGGLHDSGAPAFTMSGDSSRTEWRLVQERRDCHCSLSSSGCRCRDRREVMSVAHSRQSVGSGVSHCLEAFLHRSGAPEETCLVSKLPVWNDEVRSMVLDFAGRRVVASAKNFQLATEADPERVVCQYAKVGPNAFGLDLKWPLTVIEAFGMALTTACWV